MIKTVLLTHADRNPNYLVETLRSMGGFSPASPHHVNVYISLQSATTPPTLHDRKTIVTRGTLNYLNAMKLGLSVINSDPFAEHNGVLIVEDDVEFTENWQIKLSAILHSPTISSLRPGIHPAVPTYILSLFHFGGDIQPSDTPIPVALRYPHPLRGTQALYYPETALRLVLSHLEKNAVNPALNPEWKTWDVIVDEALAVYGIVHMTCNPLLCQHIGEVSSVAPHSTYHFNREHYKPR